MQANLEKENAALAAVTLVQNGMTIGLGTGSTAAYAIRAIGRRVEEGLQIKAVPTSAQSASLAAELHIPLMDISEADMIDLTIDGADEFTAGLTLLKGGGGALLKEKIVAVKSRQVVIIADSSKYVERLGKFRLPVEVIPAAAGYVLRELTGAGRIRQQQGKPFVTEQGNYILDVDFGLIADPHQLDRQLNNIVGVVEHGLFVGIATRVIMGEGNSVRIFET
jgi:ribose 5-phosphate isomerase A